MPVLTDSELLKKYKSGLVLADLYKTTGISTTHLSHRLRKLNPNYSKESKRWLPIRRRAFLQYVKGNSLRKIGRELVLADTTIMRWFKAMHPDYVAIAHQGIFSSTKNYLNSAKARRYPNKSKQVESWLLENLPELIASEASTSITSFSTSKERRLS